jgi:hypothetical protein
MKTLITEFISLDGVVQAPGEQARTPTAALVMADGQ